ncbi:MAG: class I SAM-dependent methyltransferase [Gomphosphaeria aponina SAG 52.96 = DSM 107014]|uniref:Class I SAM-dependent methyltransferase n=1 Tax=Gomphosphaeria aponina SAG 52.96 = DSM 107014 TaxID=1521640 RepID=A0A941JNC1_9CHRO|nr:class I SAM-dependent methyltransferase [Gomphosphaeria aponina SAG 52.96 = DSM 107014]
MTATQIKAPGIVSQMVNGILAIKPLANFAKYQARKMMIERAEKIGVPWRENVAELRKHDWENEFAQVNNPQLIYPEYYVRSFHAYEQGNLNWDAALEVESAAYAVHAKIWPDTGAKGDTQLRQAYHQVLEKQINIQPQNILDLGCSVGMSTFALQEIYPHAQVTGLDLSPYYLAVAQYSSREKNAKIQWVHGKAENTEFADASFDLVSAFLMFHELPQLPTIAILKEARRLLCPGGYLGIMDMNPNSEVYAKMPPYILTLLKSTEPYLDDYFTLNMEAALLEAGFNQPIITPISPRHRAIIAQVEN